MGYGDKFPTTVPGRIFAIILMLTGVVIISLLSGTIASIYVDRKIQEGKGLQELALKNHMLVCGWNRNTEGVLEHFLAMQKGGKRTVVLINDMAPEGFQELKARFSSLELRFVKETSPTRRCFEEARPSRAERDTRSRLSEERASKMRTSERSLPPWP